MPGRVFVTGASGFVGSYVVRELRRRGYGVNALVNQKALAAEDAEIRSVKGDLFDSAALDAGMRDCDAVIHLVGIIMERRSKGAAFERIHVEGSKSVVAAAGRNGVKRFIHMSALGTRENAASTYHRTKFAAEQAVRDSRLDWTILRPSLIHGRGGELTEMLIAWAKRKAPPFLFMPYFGRGFFGLGGAGLLQPVHVEEVARAFVDALEKPQTIGKTYELAGAQRLTWRQLHHAVSDAVVGKKRWSVPIPAWKAKLLTYVIPNRLLGFNRDQVIMSQEDNTGDIEPFATDFEWRPAPFAEMLLKSFDRA